MTVLRTAIDAASTDFAANDAHNRALAETLRETVATSALTGISPKVTR